jgi:hypothetical protein
MTDYPAGCYSLWKLMDGSDLSALPPGIVGLFVQTSWRALEPSPGVYKWGKLDPIMDAADTADLAIVLSLGTGATQCPDWLLNNPSMSTIGFVDTNPNHATYGKVVTAPIPWDAVFLARKTAFYEAAGKRYCTRPHVAGVAGSFCACGTGDDWGVPSAKGEMDFGAGPVAIDQPQQWSDAGYSTAKMLGASRQCLADLDESFPASDISIAMGWAVTGAAADAGQSIGPSTLAHQILDEAATSAYASRFLPQFNRLNTNTPSAHDPAVVHAGAGTRNELFRMFAAAKGQFGWQMGLTCGDEATLAACQVIGSSYPGKFYQLWKPDAVNPALADRIAAITEECRAQSGQGTTP